MVVACSTIMVMFVLASPGTMECRSLTCGLDGRRDRCRRERASRKVAEKGESLRPAEKEFSRQCSYQWDGVRKVRAVGHDKEHSSTEELCL